MDRGAWWATVHGVAKNQTRRGPKNHFKCCLFEKNHVITQATLYQNEHTPRTKDKIFAVIHPFQQITLAGSGV